MVGLVEVEGIGAEMSGRSVSAAFLDGWTLWGLDIPDGRRLADLMLPAWYTAAAVGHAAPAPRSRSRWRRTATGGDAH
jgi:hypothetical protein